MRYSTVEEYDKRIVGLRKEAARAGPLRRADIPIEKIVDSFINIGYTCCERR